MLIDVFDCINQIKFCDNFDNLINFSTDQLNARAVKNFEINRTDSPSSQCLWRPWLEMRLLRPLIFQVKLPRVPRAPKALEPAKCPRIHQVIVDALVASKSQKVSRSFPPRRQEKEIFWTKFQSRIRRRASCIIHSHARTRWGKRRARASTQRIHGYGISHVIRLGCLCP